VAGDVGSSTSGLGRRVIVSRWDGVLGAAVFVAVMAGLAVLYVTQGSVVFDHGRAAFLAEEMVCLSGVAVMVARFVRPPRVELDEWGFRAFDPFRGSQARAWDDCGVFRYRILNANYVYMAGPGFNGELPCWRRLLSRRPIVIPAYIGMRGERFADLLNRYRVAYGANSTSSADAVAKEGKGPVDWLSLDPPAPG
jgi:hypothetical protein